MPACEIYFSQRMCSVTIMVCVVTEHIASAELFHFPPVVTTVTTSSPTCRNKFLKLDCNGLILLICSINRILKGCTTFYFQFIIHSCRTVWYYTGCFMICGHHCRRLLSWHLISKKFASTWVLFSIVMVLWMFFNSSKNPPAEAASHVLVSGISYTILNSPSLSLPVKGG